MGVTNLWKLLKEYYCADKNMDWRTMKGKVWAVDLSFWIVEASTAMQHLKYSDPTFKPHLRNLFFRIKHLLSIGILLICVFDGAPPPQKFLTLQKRGCLGNINKRNKKKKYTQSTFGRQCRECIKLLNILGVPYIDLKYGEAEAYCSLLNKYGIVDAVLTPDGDAFLFGANKVFTGYQKTNASINCCNINYNQNKLQLNQRKFIAVGLLLGSDYCDGVKGIGYKRAIKLLESAVDEYSVNINDTDWINNILSWCSMDDQEIELLFDQNINRKKNKTIEKFINNVRLSYNDIDYLKDIIDAYLNPEFHQSDQNKLLNQDWIKWKCPNFIELIDFSLIGLNGMELKHIIKHTLDITFDLYLFDYVDNNDKNKFDILNIIKSRTRSKISMYSIQWKCNDNEINDEIFKNDEYKEYDLKCEGLHLAEAIKILYPHLVTRFENDELEKKRNKKPRATTTKKKIKNKPKIKDIDNLLDEIENIDILNTKSKKKKNNKRKYTKYKKSNYNANNVKNKIDINRKGMIYSQNQQQLNDVNELISSLSLENSKKKKKKRKKKKNNDIICDNQIEDDLNRSMSQLSLQNNKIVNQSESITRQKRKKKIVNNKQIKRRGRGRGVRQTLLSDSSDGTDDKQIDLRIRLKKKLLKKKRIKIDDNIEWQCKKCTFVNNKQQFINKCELCGNIKNDNNNTDDQCTFKNNIDVCNNNKNTDLVNDNDNDDIWDLTQYTSIPKKKKQYTCKPKKKKQTKEKIIKQPKNKKQNNKPLTGNTETSTASWKCSYCNMMIPISVFVCPYC